MDVDGTFLDVDIPAPDRVQKLLAGKYPGGAFQQHPQQPVFGRAQMDRPAFAAHLVGGEVHLDAAVIEHLFGQRRAGTPDNGAGAGHQFVGRKRLDHVVVGAGIETANPVTFLAAGRQHDDRRRPGFPPLPDHPANLDPRKAGQHPVEHDQVGAFLVDHDQGFLTVHRGQRIETGALEVVPQHLHERRFVFNDQDQGFHLKPRVSRWTRPLLRRR